MLKKSNEKVVFLCLSDNCNVWRVKEDYVMFFIAMKLIERVVFKGNMSKRKSY